METFHTDAYPFSWKLQRFWQMREWTMVYDTKLDGNVKLRKNTPFTTCSSFILFTSSFVLFIVSFAIIALNARSRNTKEKTENRIKCSANLEKPTQLELEWNTTSQHNNANGSFKSSGNSILFQQRKFSLWESGKSECWNSKENHDFLQMCSFFE